MLQRRVARPLIAAVTVALLACAPGVSFALSASSGSKARVYVANRGCRGHTFRPHSITLACGDGNLYATEILYSSGRAVRYGSTHVVAVALLHQNDCKPDCAAGHFTASSGALILKRVVRCADHRLYYSRAEYESESGIGEANIQPFERCHYIRYRG